MDQERLVPFVLSSWKPSQWEDSMQPAENNIWVMQECDSKRILAAQRGMHFSKHPTVVRCCKSRVLSPICSNSLRYKLYKYDYSTISSLKAWGRSCDGSGEENSRSLGSSLPALELWSRFWVLIIRFPFSNCLFYPNKQNKQNAVLALSRYSSSDSQLHSHVPGQKLWARTKRESHHSHGLFKIVCDLNNV